MGEKTVVKTKIIKRNGREVNFKIDKIINAIESANKEVDGIHQMNKHQVQAVAETIARRVSEAPHAVNVEDIQDMVETGIMEMRCYEVAQKYVRYRYKREISRKTNTTDNGILALIDQLNEEVKQENSNKNPVINSTMFHISFFFSTIARHTKRYILNCTPDSTPRMCLFTLKKPFCTTALR